MEKQHTSIVAGIKKYGQPYLRMMVIAIILAILGSLATLIGPNQLSKITNLITAGLHGSINLTKIGAIVLLLAIVYLVGAFFSYGQGYLMATVSQKFTQDLRTKISHKINQLPLSYFDTHDEGDTLSRVTNDLDTFGQSLNQSLGTLVSSLVLIVGTIIMMTFTNWIMSVTAIIAAALGMIGTMWLLSHSQQYFTAQQNQLADVSGFVEEVYSGQAVVKTYNDKQHARDTFVHLNTNLYNSVWKSQFLSGIMQPLMTFIGNFAYVAVAVVGALLVLNHTITIGVVVAFIVYVKIFTQPLSQVTQAFASLQSAQAALRRVFEFLDEPDEKEAASTEHLNDVKGQIDFDDVSFGYNKGTQIIKDFSAHIKPGQKVAIVGPTGSGKTTLISLLMGFYPFNQGSIKIDGIDTHNVPKTEIRDQFDMVLQDTWLFEDTIMNNLKYNQPEIDDERVYAAAKAVGIDHFIKTLPNGYDTVLNDSVSLSVGQKQLLTIARALVRNKPMLILDEATSSVDTRTEEQLQQAMDVLTKGRTSLVIAHRLSTIKNADNILVLKDGQLIESGTHDQLMSQNGFYANLYNSQFESLTA
ncbi:ABC transporter ATP-binding protein [Lactobacillus selangorensis]|uniref:ABC transporter ATP-binding protein n=1 Tax=Lactobacillus selangorensis TaxID=81857 RepID=A0A0R2FLI8_9LACO|nr:ABC transporter ATP-binding protein [Lactobacillus selangorensis]KRN28646.1 ABC transporter ATP-binding protein [Lactobacillus selangorensis]KRN32944.1 ABC transporter ATP-binding protein [Lactobacillus selangorensis]